MQSMNHKLWYKSVIKIPMLGIICLVQTMTNFGKLQNLSASHFASCLMPTQCVVKEVVPPYLILSCISCGVEGNFFATLGLASCWLSSLCITGIEPMLTLNPVSPAPNLPPQRPPTNTQHPSTPINTTHHHHHHHHKPSWPLPPTILALCLGIALSVQRK